MIQNKSLIVTFSNGSSYLIPVSAIINHYAANLAQKALGKAFEEAKKEAINYFEARPDCLLEYASSGMSFIDVILVAQEHTLTIAEKEKEWKKSTKFLVNETVDLATTGWPRYTLVKVYQGLKRIPVMVRNGKIEYHNNCYWNTRLENLGYRMVTIQIDDTDERYVSVYSVEGDYICTAGKITPKEFKTAAASEVAAIK